MIQAIKDRFHALHDESYENKVQHYNSSKSSFKILKFLSFFTLAFVSLNFSIDLFMELGSTPKDNFFFVLAIVGLELSKLISLVVAKSELNTKVFSGITKGVGFICLYLILASVSIFSAYGFVITATEKTVISTVANSNTADIEFYNSKISTLETKIQSLLPQIARGDLSITSKEKISKQIKEWETEQATLFETIRELQKEDNSSDVKESVGMFSLMARDMGIPEKSLRFWMMIILVCVIELCIAIMSPHINIIKPKQDIEDLSEEKEVIEITEPDTESSTQADYNYSVTYPAKEEPVSVLEDPFLAVASEVPELSEVTELELPPTVLYLSEPVEEKKPEVIEIVPEIIEAPIIEAPVVEEPAVQERKVRKPREKKEPVIEKEIEEVKEPVTVRETAFEKYVKALFNNGSAPYLKDRLIAASDINIPAVQAINYHSSLSEIKSPTTGNTLIEFRKGTGKWYPNYTEQMILSLYREGKIKIKGETDAS